MLLINNCLGLIGLMLLFGCSTLPNDRLWGEDATLHPGWQKIRVAALDAAKKPQTWAPLAGAAVFLAADWDQRVSDWAVDNHPLFGSESGARNASDDLLYGTIAAYGLTALATPGGEQTRPWIKSKLKGGTVAGGAVLTATGVTEGIKHLVGRWRPDDTDNKSFPSGHATGAAAMATLASRNLDQLDLTANQRTLARVGLVGLTAGTAWARVEAQKHYPSDVLAGMAIGYYFSAVINDAFLGLNEEAPLKASLDLSRQRAVFGLTWTF